MTNVLSSVWRSIRTLAFALLRPLILLAALLAAFDGDGVRVALWLILLVLTDIRDAVEGRE